jgi:hypothetical protein
MLRFYPHRKAKLMRLEKYREAWALLDPPLPNPPITIQACTDEDYPEEAYPERFGEATEAEWSNGKAEPLSEAAEPLGGAALQRCDKKQDE